MLFHNPMDYFLAQSLCIYCSFCLEDPPHPLLVWGLLINVSVPLTGLPWNTKSKSSFSFHRTLYFSLKAPIICRFTFICEIVLLIPLHICSLHTHQTLSSRDPIYLFTTASIYIYTCLGKPIFRSHSLSKNKYLLWVYYMPGRYIYI